MPCIRNKFSHSRSELMLAVKKACGSIDWVAFEKAINGVFFCYPTCKKSEEDCKCMKIPLFLLGDISDVYYLPLGSPDLNECVAVRRARVYGRKKPPKITLYDNIEFGRRYLHYVKPTSHCEICETEFEIEDLWDLPKTFCFTCRHSSDKEKAQRLLNSATYHMRQLKREIEHERRNQRERKRLASREAAE